KYYPKMVEDEQETIYKDLFLPSLKTLIQTQLVGFRINVNALDKLTDDLNKQYDDLINKLLQYPEIKLLEHILNQRELIKWNNDGKHKKVKTIKDFNKTFNPGSTNHVAILLYDVLKIPVLELTEGGQPSCSSKTLKKLVNRITDQRLLDILQLFIDISAVDQILVLFIPAFQRTPTMSDGTKGLFGSFNLGGTKTGRLSSSKPNLQNLPSTGSPYAKPVKDIFVAPKGFIFVGADQRSLEDRISALTTRDPNKIKVYTEGYDGHCLRSYSYFQEKMPDITEEINKGEKSEVEIINSIKARYPELRQKSKSITFCLTYSGTKYALMQECGLSEEDAIQAESRYHELYKVSDQWVKDHVNKACKEGYV
ncbi:MAG: DNA polymerase, partial [Methanosphaera sp.]|nr:DNA polymerase [Methanosphaera sp.]